MCVCVWYVCIQYRATLENSEYFSLIAMYCHKMYLSQDPGIEELLQFLVAVVDTELLKAVHLEVL